MRGAPMLRRMHALTLAHLSDLHIGRSSRHDAAAVALCRGLLAENVDHVVVTGDITHAGKRSQAEKFESIFAPLAGRLTLVPGNHDRTGEDAGALWMSDARVQTARASGLHIVRVDSTGPHNRSLLKSHGALCSEVLAQVDAALASAEPEALVVLMLHHHVLPLPEESFGERISTLLGWPFASELPLGVELLRRAEGRCDLVLHGHRHTPRAMKVAGAARALHIFNAGCSTELGSFRLFTHERGRLLQGPQWIRTPRHTPTHWTSASMQLEPRFAAE